MTARTIRIASWLLHSERFFWNHSWFVRSAEVDPPHLCLKKLYGCALRLYILCCRYPSSAMSSSSDRMHRVQVNVSSQIFWIDPAYRITKSLGQGAYGCVTSAVHVASGESGAIKKVSNVFAKSILTKRALREIKYVYIT